MLASPAPSTTAFSVTKISSIAPSVGTITTTTNNPTSASKPISAVAKARVPFAIKISEGTVGGAAGTLPAGSNLELAKVTVTGTSVTRQDLRQFTAATGGIRLYNSSLTGTTYDPDGSVGGARYDTYTNKFELYSTEGTDKWQTIFYGTTKHHDSVATDGSAAAVHHTLGTGAFQAAKGSHVHAVATTRLGLNTSVDYYDTDGTDVTVVSENSASPTTIKSSSALDIPANSTVLVIASGSVSVTAADASCSFGIKTATGTVETGAVLGDTNGIFPFTCVRYYTFSAAENNVVFRLSGWKSSGATSADVYNVIIKTLTVIPFSSITTNTLT